MLKSTENDVAVGRDNMQFNGIVGLRRFSYWIVGLVLLLYTASWVVFMSLYESNTYFFTYYAVDYRNGFVRRGLAGEILKLFPPHFYFTGQLILRWLVPALYLVSLAAVAWTVAARFGRSERRLMLALLIPVLPLGFAGAVVLATPTLAGEAALAAFAFALVAVTTNRQTLYASGVYGLTIATLCLVHEAIALLVSFGAILAIVALVQHPIKVQRLSILLALGPGLVVGLLLGLLGRRDVSPQCAELPHKMMDWPANTSQGAALGQKVEVDFHDFTCRNIIPLFKQNPMDALNSLVKLGPMPWISSTVVGIIICITTFLAISRISGVPFRAFYGSLRERRLWVALGIALLIPLFATSQDWVRWWVVISFDIGVVYLLYASDQPECDRPPDRRTRVFFFTAIVLFALLPIGTVSQIGTQPDLLP